MEHALIIYPQRHVLVKGCGRAGATDVKELDGTSPKSDSLEPVMSTT